MFDIAVDAPLEKKPFVMYILPGGQMSPGLEVLLVFYSSRAGLTGLSTVLQNKTEWIISNTAKSNSTNLSFPSHGSHFALMEERKESRKGGEAKRRGGNRERQLETSVYISKAELVCQKSYTCCSALLMQNHSLFFQNPWLTKHFRVVIEMHSLKFFFVPKKGSGYVLLS